MIFVSSPYSHKDKQVQEQRYKAICEYIAKQVALGITCFSPIVYGHTLLQYHEMPSDWTFWKNFCETFLSKASELWVIQSEGWDTSEGVAAEIAFAKLYNIPIKYIVL